MSLPRLSLYLSRSPLLPALPDRPLLNSGPASQAQVLHELLTKRSLVLEGHLVHTLPATSSMSSLTDYTSSSTSLPTCALQRPIVTPMTALSLSKPLPPTPQDLSVQSVVSLLHTLEREVSLEVARIAEYIRVARESLEAYKFEQMRSEPEL